MFESAADPDFKDPAYSALSETETRVSEALDASSEVVNKANSLSVDLSSLHGYIQYVHVVQALRCRSPYAPALSRVHCLYALDVWCLCAWYMVYGVSCVCLCVHVYLHL